MNFKYYQKVVDQLIHKQTDLNKQKIKTMKIF